MQMVADFHIHSKYSRAVSRDMTLDNLDKWARIKGIHILGTGDFTHPAWMKEIKEKLEPAEPGLFKLKKRHRVESIGRLENDFQPRFILTVEISSIYSKGGKARRIHNLVFLPSIKAAEKFNAHLNLVGNIASDGRPILGMDSKELLKLARTVAGDKAFFVPAHAWTPWFSIFGSKSGFDSIDECFEELTSYISAIETGLSSDPAMNWRVSALDNVTLISNSDSHSLTRIGREANVFEIGEQELSYQRLLDIIKARDPKTFRYTVEFFPEEGKYHYDGHRACAVSFSPQRSKEHNYACPECNKRLTLGVLYRVEELADRMDADQLSGRIPFKNMVPLDQIIADAFDMGTQTKTVWQAYKPLIERFKNEFEVLFHAEEEEIRNAAAPEVAEALLRVRAGKLHIDPGYDGEYGTIAIFTADERINATKQKTLF